MNQPISHGEEFGIGTYKVGLFQDWERLLERWSFGKEHRQVTKPIRAFVQMFKTHWRKKSYWNGYLAEWHYPPDDMLLHKCGHGWSRRRALSRLGKYIVNSNLSYKERLNHGDDSEL